MKQKELVLKRPQDFELHKTSDPKELLNQYLIKPVKRTWFEDFIDEDTKEVLSIERSEIVADAGYITQDVLQQINFALQAGDIKEVEYCCFDLGNVRFLQTGRTFLVEYIEDFENHKKCLVFAKGVEQAIQIIADYLSVNFGKKYDCEVVSIKTICSNYIPDNNECIPVEERNPLDDKEYYKVSVKFVSIECDRTVDYIITADNVGKAKSRVESYIKKNKIAEEQYFNIKKAMPFNIDYVVPVEYCKMYWNDNKTT